MITTCPKCSYVRQAQDYTPLNQCPKCYIDYRVYMHFEKLVDEEQREQQSHHIINCKVNHSLSPEETFMWLLGIFGIVSTILLVMVIF